MILASRHEAAKVKYRISLAKSAFCCLLTCQKMSLPTMCRIHQSLLYTKPIYIFVKHLCVRQTCTKWSSLSGGQQLFKICSFEAYFTIYTNANLKYVAANKQFKGDRDDCTVIVIFSVLYFCYLASLTLNRRRIYRKLFACNCSHYQY